MNIEALREFIESRFFYSMDIYEYEENEKNNIYTQNLVQKHKNIKCFLSYKKSDKFLTDEGYYKKISYDCKLFYGKDLNIMAGSLIKVYILNKTITFTVCAEPILYPTHSEILVRRRDIC